MLCNLKVMHLLCVFLFASVFSVVPDLTQSSDPPLLTLVSDPPLISLPEVHPTSDDGHPQPSVQIRDTITRIIEEEEASKTDTEEEPVTSTDEPEPVTSTDEPEPVTSTDEPEPVTSTDEPEPVTSTEEPEPVTSTDEPEPVTSTVEPASDRTTQRASDRTTQRASDRTTQRASDRTTRLASYRTTGAASETTNFASDTTGPASTGAAVAQYTMLKREAVCPNEASLIKTEFDCYHAISELGLDIKEAPWVGFAVEEKPAGCSFDPFKGKAHFNQNLNGVGLGHKEIAPICKVAITCTYVQIPSDECPQERPPKCGEVSPGSLCEADLVQSGVALDINNCGDSHVFRYACD